VRNEGEVAQGHVEGAKNVPLADIYKMYLDWKLADAFPGKDKSFYVHCKTGGRSTIACSILKKAGYSGVINVLGGYDAMKTDNRHIKFVE